MASFGVLMDYHLIFIVISFCLFFLSIVLIWLINTKQAVIVAVFFLAINQLFCLVSMIGFFSIGYISFDTATGVSFVAGYEGMQMFNVIFFGLLWLNSLLLFIAVFKYMRMVYHDQMESSSR